MFVQGSGRASRKILVIGRDHRPAAPKTLSGKKTLEYYRVLMLQVVANTIVARVLPVEEPSKQDKDISSVQAIDSHLEVWV